MKMSADEAFVTLATTNYYCKGATVVAKSLRRHGTTRKIVVMVTPNVSNQSRLGLERVFDEVMVVDVMDSKDHLHLALLARPDLGVTFTKIHCWTLTQYRKCVFLDADTLVLSDVDELFEREELSAAPDPGWPDCFNSGVFVFRPSLHTHTRLLDHALEYGSFDGGDQGLLNSFFNTWPLADISRHLPFIYNLSASSVYTYLPAFQQFGHKAKIVHFIGATKPWNTRSQTEECDSNTMEHFLSLWWREFHGDTPPTAPPKPPGQGRDEPQQIQQDKAKMPIRQNVERPTSTLSLPTGEEPGPAPQPKMVFTVVKETLVSKLTPSSQSSHTDHTVSGEDWSSREDPRVQDSPQEAETREDLESQETDTEPQQSAEDREREQLERRALWETGQADYLGRDAFRNIQKMLDCFLE